MTTSSANPVEVNISISSPYIQQKGFNRGLILGNSNRFSDGALFAIYDSPSAMLALGGGPFMNTDPEYLAAVSYFSQPQSPADVMIGYAPADAAQIVTTAYPTVGDVVYQISINGHSASYDNTGGGDTTKSELSASLKTAIDALSQPVTTALSGSSPNQVLTITSNTAGLTFTYSTTTSASDLTLTDSTPDVGPDTGLNAIIAQGGFNWFGLVLAYASQTDQDVLDAAAWVQETPYAYIYLAAYDDAGVLTNSTSDIASQLQALGYTQTFSLWSDDTTHWPAAAWLGYGLAQVPGSWNWNFKTLTGVTPSSTSVINATAITNLNAKNCNYYSPYGGYNITQGNAVMASGQYVDIIVGVAWLKFTMQAQVLYVLVTTPKVDFDNNGIELLTSQAIRPTLLQGVDNNLIEDGSIDIPLTLASSFSSAQKSTRVLPNLPWSAVVSGAINSVTVNGTLTT